MKASFYFVCLLSVFQLNFWYSSNVSAPDEGLVAHYTFNKCEARDITGQNPSGEIFGDPGCHCGVEGNGVFLDGVNDYIEFPGVVNRHFNTTDFTISFYLKPGKYSVFKQSLVSKRANCESYNMLDFQLDINRQQLKTDLYETPDKYFKEISPDLPETDWIHFALVRKGIYAYTYINGEIRREGRRCSGVDIGNESILNFSNSACLASGRVVRFKGGLDELRVYDHALTDEEIARIYALNPVETAEVDCVSFIPQMNGSQAESAYFCEKSFENEARY